mmetsp:Transcript_30219/g.46411  ORF Transcript_30219/g.46411 Transcript_30219/m.46411 type:complete len:102 (-) Transcript_30219:337-642(-)
MFFGRWLMSTGTFSEYIFNITVPWIHNISNKNHIMSMKTHFMFILVIISTFVADSKIATFFTFVFDFLLDFIFSLFMSSFTLFCGPIFQTIAIPFLRIIDT